MKRQAEEASGDNAESHGDRKNKGVTQYFQSVTREAAHMDGLACVANLSVTNSNTIITIVEDSVANCTTGAIVNAAGEGCLGGGGVDGEISRLGGDALYEARRALPMITSGGEAEDAGPAWKRRKEKCRRCITGDAKITISGELPCEYVIHAVGPNFNHYETDFQKLPEEGMQLLTSAYQAALARGAENSIKKIAFCMLSAGVYRGSCSLPDIIKTGLETIAKNTYPGLERVYFCAFMPEEKRVVWEICDKIAQA